MDFESFCRPKLDWPVGYKRSTSRQRAAFKTMKKEGVRTHSSARSVTIHEAVSRVRTELSAFTKLAQNWRCDHCTITANWQTTTHGDFRAGQCIEPADTGVAIYFTLDDRDLVLCCDKWDRVADNIAAIAATIAAMRGLERWGVTESERAFTGFSALPAPGESESNTCWNVLQMDPAGNHDRDAISAAYQKLAKALHADGKADSDEMRDLNAAKHQALDTLPAQP